MSSTLLIVADDKLGGRAVAALPPGLDLRVAVDASGSFKRRLAVLRRGSISVRMAMKMVWAEKRRNDAPPPPGLPRIESNAQLLERIDAQGVTRVYLFRAGLIVNAAVLASGAEILNVHCARLPDYGGLGAITRALRDGAFEQAATLHHVTERIDAGRVLATEAYRLDPSASYRANEDAAYDAGIRMLMRELTA